MAHGHGASRAFPKHPHTTQNVRGPRITTKKGEQTLEAHNSRMQPYCFGMVDPNVSLTGLSCFGADLVGFYNVTPKCWTINSCQTHEIELQHADFCFKVSSVLREKSYEEKKSRLLTDLVF